MRCPKCGYISFDYNQLCPKCNKDISDEQAKLNLPTYKHNPPSLLGMLIGAGDESNVGFTLDSSSALKRAGVGLDFEETDSMMDSGSISFGEDDHELEISLSDDSGEFELPEIVLDDESGGPDSDGPGTEDADISMGLDEVSFESSEDAVSSPGSGEDTELDLDLDEIALDEGIEKHSTVELNVSDLKINETGELEISSLSDDILSPENLPDEDEIKIDEIDIDSKSDLGIEGDTTGSLELSDNDLEITGNNTGSLELSDLTIDDSDDLEMADTAEGVAAEDEGPDEEDSLDLGELAFEEDGESLANDETQDLDAFTLEDADESDDDGLTDSMNLSVFGKDEEESLDLGDLAFEEDDGSSKEDDSLDLSDLTFDDTDSLVIDESLPGDGPDLDNEETGELQLSYESDSEKTVIIDETSSFDPDEPGLDAETEKHKGESIEVVDDELTIDLENLDLDIDLEDSGDKK